MTEGFKLYWKLYYEWFPNDKIKIGFKNLLDKYLYIEEGKIIDIGCGQSPYLIDMLNSNFKLYAVDIEPLQIEYLQKRVSDSNFPIERINYSTNIFPSKEFEDFKFTGIILSNILQFYTLPDAKIFTDRLKNSIVNGGIIVITAHSWKHPGNKVEKKEHFKHFYSKSDLYKLFPKKEYEYLYVTEQEAHPDKYEIEFLKEWIKQVHIQLWNNNNLVAIEKKQNQYIDNSRINNITMVLKKK